MCEVVVVHVDGQDHVSELQPPMGLLFIPQIIYEYAETREMILTGENRRTRRKPCLIATLSTTNATWTDRGVTPGLRGEKPATNR
jgi:hypothetical protein